MPSLEQIGLPLLIVGALVTLVGFFWLLRVAFAAGYFWGMLLFLGNVIFLGAAVWLVHEGFETQILLGVLVVALIPYFLFVPLHRRKSWKPTLVMLVGLGIIASPLAINWVVKSYFPEGPRQRVVEGETHVTLTGLAGYDYASLAGKTDIQVLQMANADVTDETLRHLQGLMLLKELDLNDTQVTDAGLAHIARFPTLEKLRLRNTRITDAGFRQYLYDLDWLDELDLTGTAVTGKTVRAWKSAKEGRKALK